MKSARVSALTGSVPRKMAEERQRVSAGIELKSPDSLQPVSTTKPLVRVNCSKKTVYDSSYFATCN